MPTGPGGRQRLPRHAFAAANVLAAGGALATLGLAFPLPTIDASWLLALAAFLAVPWTASVARARWTGWIAALDASFVVELCALVVLGPVGAALVAFLPDLAPRLRDRKRLLSLNPVTNAASIGWECVLEAVILGTAPGAR